MSRAKLLDGFARVLLQRGLQHEIFGRIADDEEFGEENEVGFRRGGLGARGARLGEIAGDVAHHRVELGQRDATDDPS